MKRDIIKLNAPERFSSPYEISREKLMRAAERACDKLEYVTKRDGLGFPGTCSVNYRYLREPNKNWETGMYTGCFWLAYQLTGNRFFKECAEAHLKTYEERLDKCIGMDSHDVGFVFTPSCVAAYKLTGNEYARDLALRALDYFFEHSYSHEGKFIIRSWRNWATGGGCRTMMDSLMNAPLLYWASEETGDGKYREAALDHTRTTEKYLIRRDSSSYHHYQFDPKDASPLHGVTLQGNSDESCWSRGHAWGMYGFPIAYHYTGADFLPEVHKDIAYFMLNHLPEDNIPYWDYDFVSGDEPRDASASCISVCGMHEILKKLPDTAEQKSVFAGAAPRLLEAVIDNCTEETYFEFDGLIRRVTHAKPQGTGFDECAVYGDFFYLEALARYLLPDFKMYW